MLFLAFIYFTCESTKQLITLFALTYRSTSLWKLYLHHICNFLLQCVHHLLHFVNVAFIPISCQSWELKLLSTIIVDIPVNRSFQSYLKPVYFSVASIATQYLEGYASRHLLELAMQIFGATKTLSTVGVDIPVNRIFQSYQNSVNFKS